MSIPVAAIRDGFVALGLGGDANTFVGSRPAAASGACTVLFPSGGQSDPDVPLDEHAIQVAFYDPSQALAYARAQAAYQALHRRERWTLSGWVALSVLAAQPPFGLPPLDAQSGRLYRVVINLRITMREEQL